MHPITLTIRWHELFGENPADITPELRRKRWEEWKALGNKTDAQGRRMAKVWSKSDEKCTNCAHMDKDWCNAFGLPCTVNPVLTYRHNMIGMACGGAGFEAKQLNIFYTK